MTLLLAYLPTLLVTASLLLAERWYAAPSTDWWRNLECWGLQLVVALSILPLFHIWDGAALLDGAKLPFWAGFPIFLTVKDLGEYLFHRAQHSIPALWTMHSLHHSDPEMAVLTTQRHFWGEQLLKQVTIWSATLMVIRPTSAIVLAYGTFSLINLVTHCGLPINLGRMPEHFDSNFAALFPIFDVICGSYHQPDGYPPTGLKRKPETLSELLIWPMIFNRPIADHKEI